jgi:hypothetical protein
LAGSLDKVALATGLGDPAVSRQLTVQDVIKRDSGRQTSGADDFQLLRELADED